MFLLSLGPVLRAPHLYDRDTAGEAQEARGCADPNPVVSTALRKLREACMSAIFFVRAPGIRTLVASMPGVGTSLRQAA
jgi:hypothetical protein